MSKQAQHTPGPWTYEDATYSDWGEWAINTPLRRVALVNDGAGNAEANARLIAAAPRMYDFIAILANLVDFPEAKAILAAVKGEAATSR
jgi:hypothetical protein